MSEKVRVAIRVHEGQAVVEEAKLSDDVTCVPGEAYTVDMSYAVKIALARGDLVELKGDEEAPQPSVPDPSAIVNPTPTAADFLE